MFVAVSSAAVMSSEMTSLTSDRPMPVVPAASDPHGPVIIKYTVLLSYPLTFVIGLAGNTLVLFVVSRYSAIRNRSVSNYYISLSGNTQRDTYIQTKTKTDKERERERERERDVILADGSVTLQIRQQLLHLSVSVSVCLSVCLSLSMNLSLSVCVSLRVVSMCVVW